MKKPTKRKKMPASHTGSAQGSGVAGSQPVRRSIPVQEVEDMLSNQRRELSKNPTIYDERLNLIQQIKELDEEIERHESYLHSTRVRRAEMQKELSEVVKAISLELSVDHLH